MKNKGILVYSQLKKQYYIKFDDTNKEDFYLNDGDKIKVYDFTKIQNGTFWADVSIFYDQKWNFWCLKNDNFYLDLDPEIQIDVCL